jgi:uncharacterized protein (DUF3820 family)
MKQLAHTTTEFTDEQWNRISNYNDSNRDKFNPDNGEYFITTGPKSVMFVLYRTHPKCFVGHNISYVGPLSTDADKAISKAIECAGGTRMLGVDKYWHVDYEHSPEVIEFGKYKGERIEDIAKKDMGYLVWIDKNASAKTPNGMKAKNLEVVRKIVEKYFDNIKKKNEEECHSEFVGEMNGNLKNVKLSVCSCRFHERNDFSDENFEMKCQDENGNLIFFTAWFGTSAYEAIKNMNSIKELTVKSCKVKRHFEKLGRKITLIKNVKIA